MANKGTLVGAEIDPILSSPFHQTVVAIQQEVERGIAVTMPDGVVRRADRYHPAGVSHQSRRAPPVR